VRMHVTLLTIKEKGCHHPVEELKEFKMMRMIIVSELYVRISTIHINTSNIDIGMVRNVNVV